MKKAYIEGTSFGQIKSFEAVVSNIIVDDTDVQDVDFTITNYRIEPKFIPNKKVKSKYKRNLKYKQKNYESNGKAHYCKFQPPCIKVGLFRRANNKRIKSV